MKTVFFFVIMGSKNLERFPILLLSFHLCMCLEFNRNNFGVSFSPYVKHSENGEPIPPITTYTFENVKTMLKVVSTKFSKIITMEVGALTPEWKLNETYYNGSLPTVYTAEAAARINKEKNKTVLTVIIGVAQRDSDQMMLSEIFLALEAAQKANNIHSGTVMGINIDRSITPIYFNRTLNCLKLMRHYATQLDLKLGSTQDCYGISTDMNDSSIQVQKQIVQHSDFTICGVGAPKKIMETGANNSLLLAAHDCWHFNKDLKVVHPGIEVMCMTLWSSEGDEKWENLENFKIYWEAANQWASRNNVTMYIVEAFDNPFRDISSGSSHFGWWKLKENFQIDLIDGYIEKVSVLEDNEKPDLTEKGSNFANLIIIWAVGATFVFIFTTTGIVFWRIRMMQRKFKKKYVKQFMEGTCEQNDDKNDNVNSLVEAALKFPYDMSYEIQKDKLKIDFDKLLGAGQFGCVYKAQLETKNGIIHVALKTINENCSKSALKGLLSEIKILIHLGKHINIVALEGAYTAEILNGVIYVATELCGLGSLESYLRGCKLGETENNIKFQEMVLWSHQIAAGMEFLEMKHVVHADLATRNVLLTCKKIAKITDFGLSRRMYNFKNYIKSYEAALPWRWLAIETLRRSEFSSQSDVWSFGVTLWEIFSMGDIPFPDKTWNMDFILELAKGLRLSCPLLATPKMYQIMCNCWDAEPGKRPKFIDLKIYLLEIINDVE